MSKAWAPVGSLHPERDGVLTLVVDALDALCDNVDRRRFLGCSCPIPDTLVLHDGAVRFYFYDWAAQCVRRNAPRLHTFQAQNRLQRPRRRTVGDPVGLFADGGQSANALPSMERHRSPQASGTTDAILGTFMRPPTAKSVGDVVSIPVAGGAGLDIEDSDPVVASRLFEVEEGRGGWRVATEYFTQSSLEAFLRTRHGRGGDKGRLSILQRFVEPRPFRGVHTYSQSIFSYFSRQSPASVSVVRAVTTGAPLDTAGDDSPAHPTKRGCVYPTLPLNGRCTSERTVPLTPEDMPARRVETIEGSEIIHDICLSMSKYVCHALERRRMSQDKDAFSCGRQVRPVSAVVLEYKLSAADGYLYWVGLQSVRHTADMGGPDSSFHLTSAATAYAPRNVSHVVRNSYAAFHLEFSASNVVYGESVRKRPAHSREGSSTDEDGSESDVSERRNQAATTPRARCPNCLRAVSSTCFVSVRVQDLLRRMEQASVRGEGRPKAVPLGLWTEVPTVLQGLSASVEEMRTRPAWRHRCVKVCSHCSAELDVPPQESVTNESALDRCATILRERGRQCRAELVFAGSEITDALVTTDLQALHRRMRQIERVKFFKRSNMAVVTGGAPLPIPPASRPGSSLAGSPRHVSRPATACRLSRPSTAIPYRHQLDRHAQSINTSFLRPHPPGPRPPAQSGLSTHAAGNPASDRPTAPSHPAHAAAVLERNSATFAGLSEEERALVYESV